MPRNMVSGCVATAEGYIVRSLLGLVTFLVFCCFGLVYGLILVGHVLPALAEDLANLSWEGSLVRLPRIEKKGKEGGAEMETVPKLISGFSFLTESRFSYAEGISTSETARGMPQEAYLGEEHVR
jgi:hypothetical protein